MASKKKIQPWLTSIQLLMEVISYRFPDLRWAMNPATAGNKLFHVDEAWRCWRSGMAAFAEMASMWDP